MECNGCGNPAAYRVRYSKHGECCNSCAGGLPSVQNSDVFFKKPYLDPHLVDPTKPEQKNGVWIESREHKASLMRELGWREAGDKKGGGRIEDRFAIRREQEQGRQEKWT